MIATYSVSTSIARSGQRSSQSLQQIQSSSRAATARSDSSSSRTFLGQKATQIPQPLHQSLRILWALRIGFAIGFTSRAYRFSSAGGSAVAGFASAESSVHCLMDLLSKHRLVKAKRRVLCAPDLR
jgi:hypothetical protein